MGFKWGICCYLFAQTLLGGQMEPLCKGDAIALVAPAHWSQRVEETKEALEKKGYHVILAPNPSSKHGQFAGTDEERADAILWRCGKIQRSRLFGVLRGDMEPAKFLIF